MIQSLTSVIPLLISLGLGLLVGIERTCAGKSAGMRTYALVAVSSTLLILISTHIVSIYGAHNVDVLRIAASVVTGIGFLGAGLIIFRDDHVTNLTTAAGIWFTAGIGIAVGFGMYIEAVLATVIAIFIFYVLAYLERMIRIRLGK